MANRRHTADRLPQANERISQANLHIAALAVITLAGFYFCYRIIEPFIPALAWALALAVISYPAHSWIRRRLRSDNWAAVVSTTLVVLIILVPTLLATAQIAREAGRAGQVIKEQATSGQWREMVMQLPYGERAIPWVEQNLDISGAAREAVSYITRDASRLLQGSVWAALQVLVTVFVLYYCFRDRDRLLHGLRGLIPLPPDETEETFRRVDDSIHATVYATIICSLLQGVTGGLLFWILGLPAPAVWGVIMFVLGVIPVVGAFLIWVPAAFILATQERYWAAAVLVVWGVLMAGPILNYLYAHLAGGRMRMHPVPALIAFIGGLAVFGVTGMILGPVIVVLTFELIEAWRRRAQLDPNAVNDSKTPKPKAINR